MLLFFPLQFIDLISFFFLKIDIYQFDRHNALDYTMCHILVHGEERQRVGRASAVRLIFISS